MGTFHWTGLTSLLINMRKSCFESLLGLIYPNVRQWAALCIKVETADRQTELRQDAFNKFHTKNSYRKFMSDTSRFDKLRLLCKEIYTR